MRFARGDTSRAHAAMRRRSNLAPLIEFVPGRAVGGNGHGAPVTGRVVETNEFVCSSPGWAHGRPYRSLHGLGWDHTLWRGVWELRRPLPVIAGDTRATGGRQSRPVPTRSLCSPRTGQAPWGLGVDRATVVDFSRGMIAQMLAVGIPG
jgi:hypothetical protein